MTVTPSIDGFGDFRCLRRIAARILKRERANHTLQPTALVNEVFIRLIAGPRMRFHDHGHFLNTTARLMSQILIDYARRKKSTKRVLPDVIPRLLASMNQGDPHTSIDVKSAFDTLARLDPAVARTVWLRAVEEMTIDETAIEVGIERWRVRQNYDFGVKWLADRLTVACRV